MRDVLELIEALWRLDTATPALVASTIGVALDKFEERLDYEGYRGVHALGALECGYRPSTHACYVALTPSGSVGDAGLAGRFGLGTVDFNPDIPPEGVATYVYRRARDKIEMRWQFTHYSRQLRLAKVAWTPARPPTFIYLPSYDRADQQLIYAPQSTRAQIVPADPSRALTLGAFVFEYKRHLGVYASPDGPVFFMDDSRIKGAFGEVAVTADGKLFRVAKGRLKFEIPYTPRTGLGTNPYDREQEDIDLFALMASRVGDRAWWLAYTRPWVDP